MDVPRASNATSRDSLCLRSAAAAHADWGEEGCWVPSRELSSSMSSNVSAGSHMSTGEASPRPLLLSANGGNAPWTAGARPQQRPRLQLKPRSAALPSVAGDEPRRAAIYGCARPVQGEPPSAPLRGSGGSHGVHTQAQAPADGGGWHTVGPRRQGAAAPDGRDLLSSVSQSGHFAPPQAFRDPSAWEHGERRFGGWGEDPDGVRDTDETYFPGRRALPTRRAKLF